MACLWTAKRKGNLSRFINHSCDPNCELVRWVVKGRTRIGIFAVKDIAADEPLSYDYQFDTQDADTFQCACGAATCRGTMAPKKKVLDKDSLTKKRAEEANCSWQAKGKQGGIERTRMETQLYQQNVARRWHIGSQERSTEKYIQVCSGYETVFASQCHEVHQHIASTNANVGTQPFKLVT